MINPQQPLVFKPYFAKDALGTCSCSQDQVLGLVRLKNGDTQLSSGNAGALPTAGQQQAHPGCVEHSEMVRQLLNMTVNDLVHVGLHRESILAQLRHGHENVHGHGHGARQLVRNPMVYKKAIETSRK